MKSTNFAAMKKIFVLFVIALFGLNSCNNDLNLVAPWKRIPVIYGFLSLGDTAQYIKVEKAFLDPDKNAFDLAQIADSIYFSNIEVSVIRIKTNKKWILQRVNGNNEGFPKKPGTFANDPNYLYKIKTSQMELEAGEEYKLEVRDGATKDLICESKTTVVGSYKMVGSEPQPTSKWPYLNDIRFSWNSNGPTETVGRVYDVYLKFNYLENTEAQPSKFTKKSLEWKIAENLVRPADLTSRITATVKGEDIFRFFASSLEKNPALKRIFQTYDVRVVAGGQEFQDYIDLLNASSGITSAQILPTFSNISNDGIGIFSSRTTLVTTDYSVDTPTRDSLKYGIYTKDLGFQ